MNVYDFDGTIYKKDSSIELYKYVCRKKPLIFLKCFPHQILAILKYKCKRISKEQLKETYFSFLKYVGDENTIDEFVKKEIKYINDWYLKECKEDDVIISASPEFLIKKFAEHLGVENVIASKIDINTGKFLSKNCHDKEKVSMFRNMFLEGNINKFYSDSKSDIYMARISKEAFFIRNNKIERWEDLY